MTPENPTNDAAIAALTCAIGRLSDKFKAQEACTTRWAVPKDFRDLVALSHDDTYHRDAQTCTPAVAAEAVMLHLVQLAATHAQHGMDARAADLDYANDALDDEVRLLLHLVAYTRAIRDDAHAAVEHAEHMEDLDARAEAEDAEAKADMEDDPT